MIGALILAAVVELLLLALMINITLSTYRKVNDLTEKYNRRREGARKAKVEKPKEGVEQIPLNFSTGIGNN